MKKLIALLLAFSILSPYALARERVRDANENTPPGTQTILDWADSEIDVLHDKIGSIGSSTGGGTELTVISRSWRTEFLARLELGISDFWQSSGKVIDTRHSCLIEDTYQIEDRIARLMHIVSRVKAMPRSQSDQDLLEEYFLEAEQLLKQLIYFKNALEIYGPIDEVRWKKVQKTYQKEVQDLFDGKGVPGGLSGIVLADPVYYSDTECVHEHKLGFYQTREEFTYFMEKIQAIKEFAKSLGNISGLFNSAKEFFTDERRIRSRKMRARRQATSWFAKNIEPAMNQVGLYPVYGSDYLDKTPESAQEQDEADRDAIEKEVPVNDPFEEVVKEGEPILPSTIYLWVWNEEEERFEESNTEKLGLSLNAPPKTSPKSWVIN
jgi:hypothetical protein